MALVKPSSTGGGPSGSAPADAGACGGMYPSIFEHVTSATWSDGSRRVTSSLLLFFEDGVFKICLNDRDGQRTFWTSGKRPEDALDAMEGHLEAETADWRRQKPQGARK